MTEAEETDFGRELIASMQEAAAIVRGEMDAARVHLPPGDVDVRAIRKRLGLTRPDPAARVLLMVIARSPEAVAQVVAEAQAA